MIIDRTFDIDGTMTSKKFELTTEELERAFREREHQYYLEDAKRQLELYYFGDELDEMDLDACPEELQMFADSFGYSIDEAENLSSEHFLLEKIVAQFEKIKSCNIPENASWEAAIDNVCSAVLAQQQS